MSRTGTRIPPIPTLLSQLTIDVDKDWNNKAITNMKSLKLNEALYADVIRELASGARVSLPDGLKTDVIREYTGGEGIDADHIRSIPLCYVVEIKDGTVIAHPCVAGLPRYEGTDAATVIQQAINALPANGGKIFIKKGTYTLTATIDLSGKEYVILESDGALFDVQHSGDAIKAVNTETKKGLVIRGLRLKGLGVENSGHGINLQYVDEFLIEKCEIDGFGTGADGAGIYVANSQNGVIRSNSILNCRNGYLTPQLDQGHVKGIRIIGNYFYNMTDDAIHPERGNENVIAFNVCDTFGDDGIDTWSDIGTLIIGNIVRNGTSEEKVVDGIEIGDGSDKCIVIGNVVANCGRGMHVYYSNYVAVIGNMLIGNFADGVLLEASKYGLYKGNMIHGNGTYGIRLVDASTYNLFIGNYIANNGNWGIISGSLAHYVAVLHNTVKDNAGQGIHPAANYWTIKGNEVINESGVGNDQLYGIRLEGDGHIVKYNRVIADNPIGIVSGSHTIKYNEGYVTENKGTATIAAGSTRVTVNHGLATTPSKVLITPIGDPGDRYWVENITDTSFDIVVATAPATDITFHWEAEV